ncbi:MAG: hypothetical protein PHO37_02155 [Kiritimatiellae bacterium]|nr:hypothetical protein [Kiritimatiellia bacterium]
MAKKSKNKKTQKPAKVKQQKQPITLPAAENSAQTTKSSAATPVAPGTALDGERASAPDQTPLSPPAEIEPAAISDAPESGGEQLETLTAPRSRMRRVLPDLLRVLLALSVIAVGIAIWVQPPIFKASFPHTTFQYYGKRAQEATLYRPVAMPERYYIELPEKLENRYQWFAVDRRREVVAACEEPLRRFLGQKAIRRGAPLGLDLEFRKLDGSEWLIHFYADAIVFSNNILAVQLEIDKD